MGYKVYKLMCRDRSHGEMKYVGEGNYVCSVCDNKYHDDDFDEDDENENISVYDAAEIWVSNGKDEDYTFGYSESELKRALRS